MFFFFKQKTAYEMRISDWSSDVCSSDLAAKAHGKGPGISRSSGSEKRHSSCSRTAPRRSVHGFGLEPVAQNHADNGLMYRWQRYAGDRKSVVKGKSVSVRVDLGGCRIITTKRPQKHKKPQEIYTQ